MIAQLDKEFIRARPARAYARLISHLLLQGRPLTTRGRWLNPFLLAQFRVVCHLPQLRPVRQPIFILGTGRSGTTVLGKILSLHSHVVFLNEPKALWHVVYKHEDVIGSYSRGGANYQIDGTQATADVMKKAHRLYGYCQAISGSQRILDKYPEMIFRIPFLRKIFPDARFVFVVRNGWDTVRSIASWSRHEGKDNQDEAQDWWGAGRRKWHLLLRDVVARDPLLSEQAQDITTFIRNEDMAAVEWVATMREGERQIAANPSQFHQVRYETLTRKPIETLASLMHFCCLPMDDVVLAYASRLLKTTPLKYPCRLHPAIFPAFLETMARQGYPSRAITQQ